MLRLVGSLFSTTLLNLNLAHWLNFKGVLRGETIVKTRIHMIHMLFKASKI